MKTKPFLKLHEKKKEKEGQTNIDSRGNFELITDYLRSNPYCILIHEKYINLTIYINKSK